MARRTHQQANSAGRIPQCQRTGSGIREFIDVHNEDPKPFVWTRTADQILGRIARYARRELKSHLPDLIHEPLCQEA